MDKNQYFKWYYEPKKASFDEILEDYIELLTKIMSEQSQGRQIILPLSGGLDSRSQAKVLKDLGANVQSYSYEFKDGYPETKIAEKIAQNCGFEFTALKIPKGYLWNKIDDIAKLNGCFSEFTHPRQMAVLEQLKQFNGVFSLGHWGDVFFDRGAPEGIGHADIVPMLLKKMVKPKGMELASILWNTWGLDGTFSDFLISRIEAALANIAIDNVSAKVRAFKTSQWAHRWTTTNLSVFEAAHPITLPYYDDRMCRFICTIPESYLADRKLQIAHLRQDKVLSNITWQAQRPFNLNNYSFNRPPYNLPYRFVNKLQRETNQMFGRHYVQRNWELQFLGDTNDQKLRGFLFSQELNELIPENIVREFYDKFTNLDRVKYSHPISMMLTLALWQKHFNNFSS
ncbi:asparagine synthase-related protein [uncultured Gelidibacter sp.]|uniref:asparagine synthase-related protein n=1 Tax=uncultured Gelidibacter sp. TaxID=259318 RepID=UPI002610934E|nr:asparagine synthase-related protein [uncultured Gelidibacter sp.]